MRYEDQLYSHPGYYNGALAAIEIYTRIHDHPDLTEEKLSKLFAFRILASGISAYQQPRNKKQTENELPRKLKRPNKKPKRQLRPPVTERNPSHLLLMMIPMEPSC